MEKLRSEKKRGFTLIELLVVIAIIAILAAILFPVFMAAKKRGQQANCMGNLKQLGLALETYISLYGCLGEGAFNTADAWWPYVERNPGSAPDEQGGYAGDARRLWVSRFLKTPGTAKCPADNGAVDVYTWNLNIRIDHKLLHYAWNYTMNGGYGDPDKAKRPSKMVAWVEENTDSSIPTHPESTEKYGNVINDVSFIGTDITSDRHSGMANISFADGHCGCVQGRLSWSDATWPDGTPMFYEK